MSNNFKDDYFGQQQDKSAEQTDTEQTTFYQDYTSQNAYEAPESTEPQGANGFQIASLVLGIIGMPLCCCYGIVGLFFGILGLIFAIIGNKKSGSNGIGIAGLICSIISIVLGLIMLVYMILIFSAVFTGGGPFAEIVNTPEFREAMEMMQD